MGEVRKRYRAFISYSQRDKPIARRIHRALESYRLPKAVHARAGLERTLGRFFRDDDEMGASQSLGAALEGALDDSENLIVICSPAAARSKWVDAEIRRFRTRRDARIFAVIADGQPNASDPARECFPPSLRAAVNADGERTGELDEPRAPDLRREGLKRVRVQLVAGLLDLPFDELWQRDRRRARQVGTFVSLVALLVLGGLTAAGVGWRDAQVATRIQASRQAVALARVGIADGRAGEAIMRLAPFLAHSDTRKIVDSPLRTLLGWMPAPLEMLVNDGIQPVRFRDATILLDPKRRGTYDISDVGLRLERVIRSRDGKRLVVIGDQRIIVLDVDNGTRLSHVDNQEVEWMGHALEAPSGLIAVTGAVVGSTNGTVLPYVLAISADGRTAAHHRIDAHMLWGSATGIAKGCEALLVAKDDSGEWRVEARALAATGLGHPVAMALSGGSKTMKGPAALAKLGAVFETQDAFMLAMKENPFAAAGCTTPAEDHRFKDFGFNRGSSRAPVAPLPVLDIGLPFEKSDRWGAVDVVVASPKAPAYKPPCTEAKPCPIVNGAGRTYARDEPPFSRIDFGPLPRPRWLRKATSQSLLDADRAIFADRVELNSGNLLTMCRRLNGADACFQAFARGEDHRRQGFLRSQDGRYLLWPFGGTVVDLDTLEQLVATRAIPEIDRAHYDFEVDRPGLTLVLDGRLVTFVPNAANSGWVRTDGARASRPYGILLGDADKSRLHTLASLGGRQYLAVRTDGAMARLDASTSEEVWRMNVAGLGEIRDVQLNPERSHVLVMGLRAWRLFGLDGFALSGLLTAPPLGQAGTDASTCRLQDVPGSEGEIVMSCAGSSFQWRPRVYQGEIDRRLASVTCVANVSASAAETLRQCLFGQ